MSTKHTPGPWRLHDMERFTVVAGTPGTSYSVADCHSRNLSDEERESNARLIAAAPELLEAAQGLLEQIRKCPHIDESQLLSAVAKATGGAK